ncbi:MAG: hypothetical protein BGO96_15690 [Micrococcales bacterium 73-15]|uniref:hypothetical protein n=1 Tax=Salana multivorans TaxID=120377 RepID=UPI00095B2A20|nr:hypothetical protein [Salana multivorans]OJX94342.1 MAG: hypothetical protein BGO96_15690 [Micrococcales bacterium 73-15]
MTTEHGDVPLPAHPVAELPPGTADAVPVRAPVDAPRLGRVVLHALWVGVVRFTVEDANPVDGQLILNSLAAVVVTILICGVPALIWAGVVGVVTWCVLVGAAPLARWSRILTAGIVGAATGGLLRLVSQPVDLVVYGLGLLDGGAGLLAGVGLAAVTAALTAALVTRTCRPRRRRRRGLASSPS